MKTMNKVLLTTIAVSLIACGGGGSSSSKGSSISTTKTPTTKKPAVTTPTKKPAVTTPTKKPAVTTTPTPSTNTNTSNGFFKISKANWSTRINKKQNEDIDTLSIRALNIVGGEYKELTLIPEGFSVGRFYIEGDGSNNPRVVSGTDYSHVKFGLLESKLASSLSHPVVTFAQGYSTLDMPTTGKAVYKGDFASSKEYIKSFNDVVTGEITFNVDFAGKTITGDIAENDHISFKKGLNGKINGNTFSSKNTKGHFEGYFYGPKATELGGTYLTREPRKEVRAAFGAKKK